MILTGVPILLGLWVIAAHQYNLDIRFTARAGSMCVVPLLFAAIFYPLFTKKNDRNTIFICAWFLIAIFFNLCWEMPQVVFSSVFKEANQNLTLENLPYFIAWWGYTTSDLDYFNLSRFFFLAELSFWPINLLSVIGLYHMFKGRVIKAMVWFCICGSLQVYNITCIFIPYGGIVEHFENIATGSPMTIILYYSLNLMWALAALVVIVLSCRKLFEMSDR